MSFDLTQEIKILNPHADNDILWGPYDSLELALEGVPIVIRKKGRTVGIINDVGAVEEYWFKNGIEDIDLVSKNQSVGTIDGLIEGGEIDVTDFNDGNITVAPSKWLLTTEGVQRTYATVSETLFSDIVLSDAGKQRFVAFYGTDENTIIKVEGTESEAAVLPNTPIDTVLLGYTLITDEEVEPPIVDLSGYAKLSSINLFTQDNTFNGNVFINNLLQAKYSQATLFQFSNVTTYSNDNANRVINGVANIKVFGGNGGLKILGTFSYNSIFYNIWNESDYPVTIVHQSDSSIGTLVYTINCPNNEDYILEPGEFITLSWANLLVKPALHITSSNKYKLYNYIIDTKEDKSNKSQPNGYASLDANGTVPISELPDSLFSSMKYGGGYDGSIITASASFPQLDGQPLPDAEDYEGLYLISTADYTYNGVDYFTGDWILSNGVEWTIVRNTDAVRTVFGRTGDVVITPADLNLNTNNRILIRNGSGNFSDIAYTWDTVNSTIVQRDVNGRISVAAGIGVGNAVNLGQMNTALDLKVDKVGSVTSVFGRTGDVNILPSDLNLTTNNAVLARINSTTFAGIPYTDSTTGTTLARRRGTGTLRASNATENDELVPLGQMNAALDLKLDRTFSNMSGITSGTNTEYTLTLTPNISSYTSLSLFVVRIHINCGANPTLNINNLGAKPLLFFNNSAVTSGQLVAGYVYLMVYNASNDSFSVVGLLPQSFFDSRYIINTTSQTAQNFNITGSGRIDGGLGLGIAPNTAARETIGANTSSIGQLLLTPSTTDYTGTLAGMFWNNAGEIKFLDSSIVNRLSKIYNNELLKGSTNRVLEANQYGDISAVDSIIEAQVYDIEIINAIKSADYSLGYAIISEAGKVVEAGQYYFDEDLGIYYFCVSDNQVIKISSNATPSTKQTITLSQADLLQDENDIWYLPYNYTEDIVPVHILKDNKTLVGWQLDRTFAPARLYGFVDNSTATIKLTLI